MKETVLDRFLSKINKTDTCWLWTATKNHRGYGQFVYGKSAIQAHRFSYMIFCGPIPDGIFVCHACDVRECVNPEHLWLGTAQENTQDSMRKGRFTAHTRHVTCKKGHMKIGDNLMIVKGVKWTEHRCRICHREKGKIAARIYRAKKKAAQGLVDINEGVMCP